MAKSLRSKWRRKCRAVKRVRYGQKELERLKNTLANDVNNIANIKMDLEEIVTVVDPKVTPETVEEVESEGEDIEIEIDDGSGAKKKVFNTKTMRDANGTFPVWMHPRKARKHSKKVKRLKKKQTKVAN